MGEIYGTQMSNLYKNIFKFLREGITLNDNIKMVYTELKSAWAWIVLI
jgi:hypothetical protein